ncbi:MAG: hypothetical protein R6U44_12020 [Archaeoglobaceae archaeon]
MKVRLIMISILILGLLLSGCSDTEETDPPQVSNEYELTVSSDGYDVLHVDKVQGYKYAYLTVESDQPLDVWVMPTEEDVDTYLNEEGKYDLYQHLSRRNDDEYFASEEVTTDMHIIVENAGYDVAHVQMWIVQSQEESRR